MCICVANTHSCTQYKRLLTHMHTPRAHMHTTRAHMHAQSLSFVHSLCPSLCCAHMHAQSLSHMHPGQRQCSCNCCVTCLTRTVNPRHGLIPDMVLFVFDSSGASLSPRGQPKRLGFSGSLSTSPPPPATPTTLTPSSTPSPTSVIPPLSRNVASSESKMDESAAEVATPKQIRFAEPET